MSGSMTSSRAPRSATAASMAGRSSGISGGRSSPSSPFTAEQREQPIRDAAGRRQPRLDRVLLAVLGRQDDRRRRPARPPRRASAVAAEAGGEVEQQRRSSQAGVAVEHGQLAQGNPAGPQPFDRPGRDVAHRPQAGLGGWTLGHVHLDVPGTAKSSVPRGRGRLGRGRWRGNVSAVTAKRRRLSRDGQGSLQEIPAVPGGGLAGRRPGPLDGRDQGPRRRAVAPAATGPRQGDARLPRLSTPVKPSVNHTNNTVNLLLHPEMQSLFAAILQVLAPFPEARQAVSEALADVRPPKTLPPPRP